VKSVYEAIAQVQSKLDPILSDQENPHFRSRYASLAQVWRHVRPHVAEAGLTLTYVLEEGRVVLRVIHSETGTETQVAVPILGYQATMQGLGGAITYARRYALHLAFALAIEGEDTDGERGAKQPRKEKEHPKLRAPAPESASTGGLKPAQVQLLDGLLGRRAKELGDDISTADIAKDIRTDRGWTSLSDCPPDQLNDLMAAIRKWEPPVGGSDPQQGSLV
jgi:hypothetical protein